MAVTRHAHTRRARELVLGGIVALLGAGTLGCGDVGDACRDCGTPDAARTDAGAMDRESGANVDASSGVDGGSDVDGGGSGVDAGPSIDCTRDVTADATGASDVTSALQSFIDASPDGSVICFEAGGQYRVDGTIHVSGRSSLIFAGRGARIFQTVRATTRIWLIDGGGSDITMRDLTVEGANPNPGKWDVAYEHNHAIQIGGTLRVELAHLTIKNIGGDGLYVSGGADRWADSVHLHDSLLDGIGRMGVAITDGGSNVVVDFNTFQRIGYYTWDLEPNGATVGGRLAGAEHVRFSDNRIETAQ